MSSAPISRNQPAPAKGWFSRNWKWFVPSYQLLVVEIEGTQQRIDLLHHTLPHPSER